MARPQFLDEDEKRGKILKVPMRPQELEEVREAAREADQPAAAWVRKLIAEALAARQARLKRRRRA